MATILNWLGLDVSTRKRVGRKRSTRRLMMEPLERREVFAVVADLMAFRPVTPFIDYARYAVPEAVEADIALGAGIRINGDDDNRNGVPDRLDKSRSFLPDDDLVRVDIKSNATSNNVNWTGDLAVWTSASKTSPVGKGQSVSSGQRIWVEYVGTAHSVGSNTSLTLTSSLGSDSSTDQIVFHTFKSNVIALGGAFQDPIFLQGTFAIALDLYQQGYDVHLYRDSAVNKQGTGGDFFQAPAYDEVKNSILNRGVTNIAMVGMSYGGGAVHDLAAALDRDPGLKGHLQYTAYIDAIEHYSFLPKSEKRLPPGTKFHDNIYQKNDRLLHGDAVPAANRNIDASNWIYSNSNALLKGKLVHLTIDRDQVVRNTIAASLKNQMTVR
jgi:hypothetical protein